MSDDTSTEMKEYLVRTRTMDFDHPLVAAFIENNSASSGTQVEKAVSLYYAVRDGFRYDPYKLDLTVSGMRASSTVEKGYGWCVSKAVLLAACCRGLGIPARLGFGDVRNHLSTERLRRLMATDIFYWHGFTEIFLDGRWLKATPAFNRELCDKFRINTLEFNGYADSVFHPFDKDGNRHMEYVNGRGYYADLPLDEIRQTFKKHYGGLLVKEEASFEQDVNREKMIG